MSGKTFHPAAEAGLGHAEVVEHLAGKQAFEAAPYLGVQNVAAGLYAVHAAGLRAQAFVFAYSVKERGKLMWRGHKCLGSEAKYVGLQCRGGGRRIASRDGDAVKRKRLMQKVGHAVWAVGSRQEHHEAFSPVHELGHTVAEEGGCTAQVVFRKCDTLGCACGAGRGKRDDAAHVALRDAEELPVVLNILRRGEGQAQHIGFAADIEVQPRKGSGIPAAVFPCPVQDFAQGLKARLLKAFGQWSFARTL